MWNNKIWIAVYLLLASACTSKIKKAEDVKLNVSKEKVGIGLVYFNTLYPIALYKNSHDTIPFDTLRFTYEGTGEDRSSCVFNTTSLEDRLQPYILSQGDSYASGEAHRKSGLIHFAPQLSFTVIEKNNDGATIIFNEETSETVFVKLEDRNNINVKSAGMFFDPNFIDTKIRNWYYYETWEHALKRAWRISADTNIAIYDKPEGRRVPVSIADYNEIAKVDSVSGNWARLTNAYYYDTKRIVFGWVKWNENDSIKVGIMLNGGYD